jgi:hypothetical protein
MSNLPIINFFNTVDTIVSYLAFPLATVIVLVGAYFWLVRPALKQNPKFAELYTKEDGFFSALNDKLGGIKQKLTTIFVSLAGFLVLAHDQIAPLVTQVGVDPATILPKVPAWAWPIATMGILWLVQYFRELSDRKARANAEALLNTGNTLAAPAPGIPVTTLPSPSAFSIKVGG